MIKESTCNAGDTGDMCSIPESGRSPREENGSPLQYACLANPTDKGAWRATVHGVAESQTQMSNGATEHAFPFLINVLHLVSRMPFSLSFFPSFLVTPSQSPCLDPLLPDFLIWNIRLFLFFFPLCLHS